MIWTVLVLLLVIPLVILLIRWKLAYRVLSSAGIKGPSPSLYYGNGKEINEMDMLKFIETNLQKYGDVFGYYVGLRSYIVVKDLEMLKQIMVKQFDVFTDREHSEGFLRKSTRPREKGLPISEGEDWKRMRKIISKSFNAVNLNRMSPIIERSCDSLVLKLSDHVDAGKSFDVWKLFGLYTMEVILATGFGHYVNMINGEVDELAEASAAFFSFTRGSARRNITILHSNFPFVSGFIRRKVMKSQFRTSLLYVESKVEGFVKERLESESANNYPDLLQLLMDARADSDDEDENTESDIYAKKLTNTEIIRTSFSFVVAGYETTANTLGYISYLLALHPAEQDKLYQEISDFYDKKPDASLYEASQSVSYVDMVIQETLRIYPPGPFMNRHTSKTVNINGHVFPENSTIIIPIMPIHHSPDIWPEPSVFKPERFTKEEKAKRHPMAHMPFGWGPRSCIGMRLALMEAKMALIATIREYKFVEAPDTEKPLKISMGVTMIPTNGVYLEVQRRQ